VNRELVDSLREEVTAFYARRQESLDSAAARTTLDTNSTYVERRAAPLAAMLRRRGLGTFDGIEVVDLGAGFGALSVYFASLGARVTALDVNERRFEVCRAVAGRHGLSIETVRSRMERLDLPDASFDAAVQSNSLCYIVDRESRAAALAETLRVLRPGGVLVTRDPNRWHPVDQFTRLPLLGALPPEGAVRMAERLGRARSRVRLTSPLGARRELRAAGFEGIRHEAITPSGRQTLKPVARYHHFTAVRPPG
jgi:ubiquinone/menaquinone biosynthesis C-methylase UbiE